MFENFEVSFGDMVFTEGSQWSPMAQTRERSEAHVGCLWGSSVVENHAKNCAEREEFQSP